MRRIAIYVAAVLLGVALSASAQEAAGVRFYIVPKTGDGTAHNAFRPKYIAALGSFSAIDYGLENTMLVAFVPTAQQHLDLTANLDVIAIPLGLDNAIGLTALSTVQAKLEGLHVPAGWVTETHTWRDVTRAVAKMFLFMKRFHAQQLRVFFESGVTLDTRINQLTAAQRNALTDAALSLGLDISGITGPMLIRQALRILGDQMPSLSLGGEEF